jgi:hypothetical protein
MSNPIDPPGGPGAPASGPDAPDEAGASASAAVFQRELESAPSADRLGTLARAVETGEVSRAEAVEALVQAALAQAADLPDALRAQVEAQLREALTEDPSLLALQDDLARAGG